MQPPAAARKRTAAQTSRCRAVACAAAGLLLLADASEAASLVAMAQVRVHTHRDARPPPVCIRATTPLHTLAASAPFARDLS